MAEAIAGLHSFHAQQGEHDSAQDHWIIVKWTLKKNKTEEKKGPITWSSNYLDRSNLLQLL